MLDVSPTRMELLKLKKKKVTAVRGHKLLKDKLDELIRILLITVKDIAARRRETDRELAEVRGYIAFAGYSSFPEAVKSALITSRNSISVNIEYEHLLNLKIPRFNIPARENREQSYGYAQTSTAFDFALKKFDKAALEIIKLAEKEKKAQMIADEIEKTKRRVNALEYILIPEIEGTIKYISMKLDELERNKHTRLMRVKDLVRSDGSE